MRVMVLNDGETYTDLAGCKIVDVPDLWQDEALENTLDEIVALGYAEDNDALAELIGTEGGTERGEDARGTVVADGYRAEAWPSVVYTFKGDEQYRSDSRG